MAHWDKVAKRADKHGDCRSYYHQRMIEVLRCVIPPGQRVVEIGCGQEDLLTALKPAYGVGFDFSLEMINRVRKRYTDLHFTEADAHEFTLNSNCDYVVLSDLVTDVWDV